MIMIDEKKRVTKVINNLLGGKDLGKKFIDFSNDPLFKTAYIFDNLAFLHRDKKKINYTFREFDLVEYHKEMQKFFTDIKIKLFDKFKSEEETKPSFYIIQNGIETEYVEKEYTPEQIQKHQENLEDTYTRLKMRGRSFLDEYNWSLEDYIEMETSYTYTIKVKKEIKNVLFAYTNGGYNIYEYQGKINDVDLGDLPFKGEFDGVRCNKDILNKKNIRQAFDYANTVLGIDISKEI